MTARRWVKAVRVLVGAASIAVGVIWFLQGVNVLPGSFMTGNPVWALRGALAVDVGFLLVAVPLGRRAGSTEESVHGLHR